MRILHVDLTRFADEIVRREQARKEELKSLKEDAKANEETEEQQEKRLENLKDERDRRKAAEKARKLQLEELKKSREESMLREKEQIEEMNRIAAERKQLEAEERAREAEILGLEQAAAAAAAAVQSGQKSVGDAQKESEAIAQRIAALEALQLERKAKSEAEDAHKRALLQAESERAGVMGAKADCHTFHLGYAHVPPGFKAREAELTSQMQRLQTQAASNSKEADAARAQAVLTQQQLISLQEERGQMAAAEAAQIKELDALRAKEKARDAERSRLDEELRQLRQTRDEADRKAAQQVQRVWFVSGFIFLCVLCWPCVTWSSAG